MELNSAKVIKIGASPTCREKKYQKNPERKKKRDNKNQNSREFHSLVAFGSFQLLGHDR